VIYPGVHSILDRTHTHKLAENGGSYAGTNQWTPGHGHGADSPGEQGGKMGAFGGKKEVILSALRDINFVLHASIFLLIPFRFYRVA